MSAACDPNGACARRSISTWPVGGLAGSIRRIGRRTARLSPRTVAAGSETAIRCGSCSRTSSCDVSERACSAASGNSIIASYETRGLSLPSRTSGSSRNQSPSTPSPKPRDRIEDGCSRQPRPETCQSDILNGMGAHGPMSRHVSECGCYPRLSPARNRLSVTGVTPRKDAINEWVKTPS